MKSNQCSVILLTNALFKKDMCLANIVSLQTERTENPLIYRLRTPKKRRDEISELMFGKRKL